MPPRRKEKEFSAPTMLRWLKIYYGECPVMIEDGRLYKEQGLKVAKGLRFAIKALEDSAAAYKKLKRIDEAKNYKDADRRLRELAEAEG